jgi:signal transduction histidine kinase
MNPIIMTNKKKVLPFVLGLLTVIGFMGTWLLSNYRDTFSFNQVNKARFEKVLHTQQQLLKANMASIALHYKTGKQGVWSLMDSLSLCESSYLVYDDYALVAWSNEAIPVSGEMFTLLSNKLVQLKNGWYFVEKVSVGDVTVLGLFMIKQRFAYENEFLKNKFNPIFGLSVNPTIVYDQDASGMAINDVEGEYLFSLVVQDEPFHTLLAGKLSLLLLIVGFIHAVWLVNYLLRKMLHRRFGIWAFFIVGLLFFGVYVFIIFLNGNALMDAGPLFSPVLFAYSKWLPSLLAFLALAVLFLVYQFWFYRLYDATRFVERIKSSPYRILFFLLGLIGVFLYLLLLNKLTLILIENSSSTSLYYRIVDLDVTAVVKITTLVCLYSSFLLLLDKVVAVFQNVLSFRTKWIIVLSISVLFVLMTLVFHGYQLLPNLWFFPVTALLLLFFKWKGKNLHAYGIFIWFVFLLSFYLTSVIIHMYGEKEKVTRELLVENLAFKLVKEEDPVAELYLHGIEKAILHDNEIGRMIKEKEPSADKIKTYLEKNYFVGYLSRYEIQVIPCWPEGDLIIEESNETFHCYSYFESMLLEMGKLIDDSEHVYFLDNDNGRVSFMGVFSYFDDEPEYACHLYLEVNSKPVFEGLGYPELLKRAKEQLVFEVDDAYSYAKYVDGRLVKQLGDLDYDVANDAFKSGKGEKYYASAGEVGHLVYCPDEQVMIVLSWSKVSFMDQAMGFSIFFINFFILFVVFSFLMRFRSGKPFFKLSIQERIQIALIGLILVILVVLGMSSVFYSIYQYKHKNSEILSQRIKSVLLEVEQKIGQEDAVDFSMHDYLQYLMQKFSNVFFCDINLFDLNGNLLATSRPELYIQGLTGELMSANAVYELTVNKKKEVILDESIGNLDYVSAYVAVLNRENRPLAYLNIPFFVGSDELREQVSSLIVAVLNVYLLFILLAISFAVFVSKRITYPLSMIQKGLGEVSLAHKNEKLNYQRKDEIGELVAGYNRMVDELADSASKLAQSERETAWREMAKQIAHEIKNPLTPMRLNVQYLQRARQDKVEDFDSFLDKVSKSLIEQIDQLSIIATEFSNFAKMPVAKRSRINIILKLRNVIAFFEKAHNITFVNEFDENKAIWVYADRDQMLRVFNNILKNAVQAIPPDRNGVVTIKVEMDNGDVILSFTDNGRGMSAAVKEKVFQPNFTTKSSGMGLGLSIVKNIITNTQGQIWFTTRYGQGTTFFIRLPLYAGN